MPFGIMAINAFICGILCLTLPETNKVVMPDTLQQVAPDSDTSTAEEENEKLNKPPLEEDHGSPFLLSRRNLIKMYALAEYC